MTSLGGSASEDWNLTIVDQVIKGLWLKPADRDEIERQTKATLAALADIGPRDVIEGQLAAQMIACHNAAMECYRRAMIPEQSFQAREAALSQANKLSRTHATLVETLNRHRGKGRQVVRVERVVIHEGAQAVVGVVAGVGEARAHFQEQPHAKRLANASVAPMLCAEQTDRAALPRAGSHGG